MPMVRQARKIELTPPTARMPVDLLTRLLERSRNFRLLGQSQIKQVLLAFALDDAFAAAAMNPAFVPGEFLKRRDVLLSQFLK
jgi:hypothetical protein